LVMPEDLISDAFVFLKGGACADETEVVRYNLMPGAVYQVQDWEALLDADLMVMKRYVDDWGWVGFAVFPLAFGWPMSTWLRRD